MDTQAERRRKQILAETFTCLAGAGFGGTSAKKLAAAAGISDTLIFKYFGTLDALFKEVLDSRLRQLFSIALPASAVSFNDILLAYIDAFETEILEKRADEVRLYVCTHVERPDLAPLLPELINSGVWLELSFRLKEKRIAKPDFKLQLLRTYLMGRLFESASRKNQIEKPGRDELLTLLDFFAM